MINHHRSNSLPHDHHWAEHWLYSLRRLPRLVTQAEVDSLKLLMLSSDQSRGIADGAARIRYLVGSKLLQDFRVDSPTDETLVNALKQVLSDGEAACRQMAFLPPLMVGVSGQRAAAKVDLQRMGWEYQSGFALSPITIHFCSMHSIEGGAALALAIDSEIDLPRYLRTLMLLSSGWPN